jgi:flagellar biosynthesis protein FlhB
MSEEDDGAEKSFDPTPKRLEDARKRGEIASAADLTTAAAYGGFALAAALFGGGALLSAAGPLQHMLGHAAALSDQVFAGRGAPVLGPGAGAALLPLAPFALLPAGAALVLLIALRGIVIAPERLSPRLSRISPLAALGHKFGPDGLFEFGKGLVKLSLFAIVLGWILARDVELMVGLVGATVPQGMLAMIGIMADVILAVCLLSLVLGGADRLWQALRLIQRLRMTRKEMLDEAKEAEGDPMLKSQRRQKAVGYAMGQMMADVPKADVVIVNPTHYAVALRWDRLQGGAPVCVAKGVDEIALRIRALAMEAGVPIHSDPPTARLLHATVPLGHEIRPDHYRAVAAAIRFADRLRQKAKGRGLG